MPFTLGCAGEWTDEARREHYDNLCQIDGRIVLAGEHASYIPAWQEGAILSALDAITRLHRRSSCNSDWRTDPSMRAMGLAMPKASRRALAARLRDDRHALSAAASALPPDASL